MTWNANKQNWLIPSSLLEIEKNGHFYELLEMVRWRLGW
jgi:hypothetical protein